MSTAAVAVGATTGVSAKPCEGIGGTCWNGEESREFFAFLHDEMVQVMERWRRRKRSGV